MKTQQLNISVLKHPVIEDNLAIIRDKNTDSERFKNAVRKISYSLILEASKNLPMVEKTVETPLVTTKCRVIDKSIQVIIAPILRAGLIFSEAASELLPFSNIHHVGMYRNEETLEPVWYYDKKKNIIDNKDKVFVIILDPMLATGNSAVDTIENFIKKGAKEENITFVSLIAAPNGVSNIQENYSKVKIVTASLDDSINEKGYILPGLGDAGDRIFNTIE